MAFKDSIAERDASTSNNSTKPCVKRKARLPALKRRRIVPLKNNPIVGDQDNQGLYGVKREDTAKAVTFQGV